ncbi:THAP5 protein, partial [Podargus strigoides]|nr:THAP5 protein [Podargus strigoides]
FPLHDKERLEKWLRNMKRDAWTPSKHQLLCSDHFTPDSLDVRWGIRYLKHTAVPTIFSSPDDEVMYSCLFFFFFATKLTNI